MQRCEYHYCQRSADGFAMVPATWQMPLRLGKKFFCKECWYAFVQAWNNPSNWKGIVKPEGADDEWRPSLMDHVRHAEVAIAFDQRHEHRPTSIAEDWLVKLRGWTPAQVKQIEFLRRMNRTRKGWDIRVWEKK